MQKVSVANIKVCVANTCIKVSVAIVKSIVDNKNV